MNLLVGETRQREHRCIRECGNGSAFVDSFQPTCPRLDVRSVLNE